MLPRILSCIQTPLNRASSQGAKKWRGPRERLPFIRNGFWPICVSNSSLRRWMKTEYEGDDLDLMYSSLVWFPGRCQKRCGEAPRGVNMVSIWMLLRYGEREDGPDEGVLRKHKFNAQLWPGAARYAGQEESFDGGQLFGLIRVAICWQIVLFEISSSF